MVSHMTHMSHGESYDSQVTGVEPISFNAATPFVHIYWIFGL